MVPAYVVHAQIPLKGPFQGPLRRRYDAPLSSSNRSSSLVKTSRNRSSSFAPRRHTVSRRSEALRRLTS